VARHKACVGGCLTRALKPVGRAELAYDDRSGLNSNAWNCVQQRTLFFQLWIFLDMLFDLFLQSLNLLLDLVEEVLMCPPNRFVLGFLQPVLGPGLFFLQRLSCPCKLLKPTLRR